MCGICGYIGHQNGFEYVYFGLEMLQNRGYDSAGICALDNNGELIVCKKASTPEINAIEYLKDKNKLFDNCSIMCGHTRWATHGSKTDCNSHPHNDYTNKFTLVHNGIIENYAELKQDLINNFNITFNSQTDSEVIVNLISVYYNQTKNVYDAIKLTLSKLEGTWGLVILSTETPDRIYCARHGSPLLIGLCDNYAMISSEQSGFFKFVKNYICLEDNDIIILKKNNDKVEFINNKQYEIKNINIDIGSTTPSPYKHWTLKEINEQPDSCLRAVGMGGRIINEMEVKLGGLINHKDYLIDTTNLILLGCGTSYHAGLYALSVFKEISGFNTVQLYDGAEFNKFDIPTIGKTSLILLSQSGETKDLHHCIKIAKENNLYMIGVVNVVDSLIAREVDCGVYLNAGREVAVASTKAFTSQVIVLYLIALWFSQIRNINLSKRVKIINSLHRLPIDIKNTIDMVDTICDKIASYLLNKNNLFILGKGISYSVAKEGSLKIKEIGYIHAEGYSSSALKHGPYSLIEDGTPIILINPNDEYFNKNNGIAEEVKSRNAYLIGISDIKLNKKYDITIEIPKNNIFCPLLANIPLQLIAYKLACLKNINPDQPRNLAKTVTVD